VETLLQRVSRAGAEQDWPIHHLLYASGRWLSSWAEGMLRETRASRVETRGMSTTWFAACDKVVRIPIGGAAGSPNVASAATVLLYEAARQRSEN
jgi:hypothetical protein